MYFKYVCIYIYIFINMYLLVIATISPPLYLAKAFSMPLQSLISWIFWQFSTLELPGCVHERTVTQAMNTCKKPIPHKTPKEMNLFPALCVFLGQKNAFIHTLSSSPPLPKQKKTHTHQPIKIHLHPFTRPPSNFPAPTDVETPQGRSLETQPNQTKLSCA